MNDSTELTIVDRVRDNPALVLIKPEAFDPFYDRIRAEVMAETPDLSTDKGRKAIASLAHKVVRTKTAIDAAGKKLNEDARAQINAVDAARRTIREKLDALAEEVRKPLTEWEEAEKARIDKCKTIISNIELAAIINIGDTSETVGDRFLEIENTEIAPEVFRELFEVANSAKERAAQILHAAQSRLIREEVDRAELERLRQEAAQREAEAAAERERHEAARREAEAKERAIAERAKIEAEAVERAAQAERARIEAERAEERRKHDAELAAARAEAERLAQEEASRKAEAERAAEEERRRAEDRKHRSEIMKAAKQDIMEAGSVSEEQAKSIVLAITGGNIRNVSMRF